MAAMGARMGASGDAGLVKRRHCYRRQGLQWAGAWLGKYAACACAVCGGLHYAGATPKWDGTRPTSILADTLMATPSLRIRAVVCGCEWVWVSFLRDFVTRSCARAATADRSATHCVSACAWCGKCFVIVCVTKRREAALGLHAAPLN